jgi:hypothetical protein
VYGSEVPAPCSSELLALCDRLMRVFADVAGGRGSQVLASYGSQLLALYSSGGFVEVFVDTRGVS